jgi:hypothetical protein
MEVTHPLTPSAGGGGSAAPPILVLAGMSVLLAAAVAAGTAMWEPAPAAAPSGAPAASSGVIDDTVVCRILHDPVRGASAGRIVEGTAVTCLGRAVWTGGARSFPSYLIAVVTATEARVMALRDSDRVVSDVPAHIKHVLGKLNGHFGRAGVAGDLVYSAVNSTTGMLPPTSGWSFAHRIVHVVADKILPTSLEATPRVTPRVTRAAPSHGLPPTSPIAVGVTASGAMGELDGARAVDMADEGFTSPPHPRRFGPPRIIFSPDAVAAGAGVPDQEPRLAPPPNGSGAGGSADAPMSPGPLPPGPVGRQASTGGCAGSGSGVPDADCDAPMIDPARIGSMGLSAASLTALQSAVPARAERFATPPAVRDYVELSDSDDDENVKRAGAGYSRQPVPDLFSLPARMARLLGGGPDSGAPGSIVGSSVAASGNGTIARSPMRAGGLGAGGAVTSVSSRIPVATLPVAAALRAGTHGVSPGTAVSRRGGSHAPPTFSSREVGVQTDPAGASDGSPAAVGAPRTPGRVTWIDQGGTSVLAAVGAAPDDITTGRPPSAALDGRAGAPGSGIGQGIGKLSREKRPRRSESPTGPGVLRQLLITSHYAPSPPRGRPVPFSVAEMEFRRDSRKPGDADMPPGAGGASSDRRPLLTPTRGSIVASAAESRLASVAGRVGAPRSGAAAGSPGPGASRWGVHMSAMRAALFPRENRRAFAAAGSDDADDGPVLPPKLPPRMNAGDLGFFRPELRVSGSLAPGAAGAGAPGIDYGRRSLSTRPGSVEGRSGGSPRGVTLSDATGGAARGSDALSRGGEREPLSRAGSGAGGSSRVVASSAGALGAARGSDALSRGGDREPLSRAGSGAGAAGGLATLVAAAARMTGGGVSGRDAGIDALGPGPASGADSASGSDAHDVEVLAPVVGGAAGAGAAGAGGGGAGSGGARRAAPPPPPAPPPPATAIEAFESAARAFWPGRSPVNNQVVNLRDVFCPFLQGHLPSPFREQAADIDWVVSVLYDMGNDHNIVYHDGYVYHNIL